MSVRRVVTGTDTDGRSVFLSDRPAFGPEQWSEIWVTDPAVGLDAVVDPHDGPMLLEPPDAVMREQMASATSHMKGVEADGFHATATVDFVMVLEGEIALEPDDGSDAQPSAPAVRSVRRWSRA